MIWPARPRGCLVVLWMECEGRLSFEDESGCGRDGFDSNDLVLGRWDDQ
jgi:hypothetical protein